MTDQPSRAERLFPLGAEYKLDSGAVVEVRKWSIETMIRVTQRVPKAIERFMELDKGASVVTIFPTMIDEIKLIVSESIGWEPSRIDAEMTADDLLGVTTVVWDHCLAGPLAKTLGLTVRIGSLLGQPLKKTETVAPTSTSSNRSSS